MIKRLLLALCVLLPSVACYAQRFQQTGDSITPPGELKYVNGVYYRITSLLFHNVELAGFIKGQTRKSIEIPDSIFDSISGHYYHVTSVADNAFKGCKQLESVTLPNKVTRIGKSAFQGCSIEKVTIPGSVFHVMENAYADNPLKKVYILSPGVMGAPNIDHSVELQNNAFGNMEDTGLKDVYISYPEPPIVDDTTTRPFPQVASGHSKTALHVAEGVDPEKYKDEPCWRDFFSYDTTGVEEVADASAAAAPSEYYTLQGIRVSASDMAPGVYIVRQGHKVTKTLVR